MAAVGGAFTFMTTWSEDGAQTPLEIVHCKVTEAPIVNPVTPDVGEVGVVMVAVPATIVHKPVPDAGVFPASVVVVMLQRF